MSKTKITKYSKALEYAKDYLWPACMFGLHDCSDSMNDAEKLEQRFLAIVDDEISINDFIKQNLRTEFIQAFKDAYAQGGYQYEDNEDDKGDMGFVNDLAFTYLEIKEDLKKLGPLYKEKE